MSDSSRRRGGPKGKKKKAGGLAQKGGGFQSLGLSRNVFRGIVEKGYKVPTPIQRKAIPLIMAGEDVVAMARTGSGKTAAFLIPLMEKLKAHSAQVGVRGIILSPTRELAEQTFRFAKDISKRTDLKIALIVGGESMDTQFGILHSNPDVIVATPGRLLHLLIEMEFKLTAVQNVVFDEADQLFEKGFEEHLKEICVRLPEERQTVLVSATLPKRLVEFARAGLRSPVLIRLDTDTKLSENLEYQFISCRRTDKVALLLHFLWHVIPRDKMTVIFVSTKHLVEYLKELLSKLGYDCAYSYGNLDQTARKIQIARFRTGRAKLLLVTDVAARGIDIPLLDVVVNFDFPRVPKLFVHRVGRVARAGRSGVAYSFVAPDEVPYLFDLHTYLGKKLDVSGEHSTREPSFGDVPQAILDENREMVETMHASSHDLAAMQGVYVNGYKQYDRSRPDPALHSLRSARALQKETLRIHPVFLQQSASSEGAKEANAGSNSARATAASATATYNLLDEMRRFKPKQTVFELNKRSNDSMLMMMDKKRSSDDQFVVERKKKERQEKALAELDRDILKNSTRGVGDDDADRESDGADGSESEGEDSSDAEVDRSLPSSKAVQKAKKIGKQEAATNEDIVAAFATIIAPGRNKEGLVDQQPGNSEHEQQQQQQQHQEGRQTESARDGAADDDNDHNSSSDNSESDNDDDDDDGDGADERNGRRAREIKGASQPTAGRQQKSMGDAISGAPAHKKKMTRKERKKAARGNRSASFTKAKGTKLHDSEGIYIPYTSQSGGGKSSDAGDADGDYGSGEHDGVSRGSSAFNTAVRDAAWGLETDDGERNKANTSYGDGNNAYGFGEGSNHQANPHKKRWDRKKKKFVGVSGNGPKMITTESGNKLPISYKSDRYKQWREEHNVAHQTVGDLEDKKAVERFNVDQKNRHKRRWHTKVTEPRNTKKAKTTKGAGELKPHQQVLKEFRRKEKIKERQTEALKKKRAKAKRSGKGKK